MSTNADTTTTTTAAPAAAAGETTPAAAATTETTTQPDAGKAAPAAADPAAGNDTTSAIGAIAAKPDAAGKAEGVPGAGQPGEKKQEGAPGDEGKDGKPVTPEEYAKAVTLGDAEDLKGLQLNPEILGAIVPKAIELGVKPEALSTLAQELTRQMNAQQAKIAQAEQAKFKQDFTERKQKALDFLGADGLPLVHKALAPYVKPGTFLKEMIDLGLGNDVDFLAMCRDFGKLITPDGAAGAEAAGAGNPGGTYDWRDHIV
jgi:hypothetical protein